MLIATILIPPKLDTIQLSVESKLDKLSAVNSYHRISYGGKTESNIHTTRTDFRNTVSTENPKSQENAHSLTAFIESQNYATRNSTFLGIQTHKV